MSLHDLVVQHGREAAKELLPADERKRVDRASAVLMDDATEFGIIYSGFCLTSLPHRRLPDTEIWVRRSRHVTLQIQPGAMPGSKDYVGVPYGSRARMILLYLQTQAVRTDSREVELGRSMLDWMRKMGIEDGGKQYKDVREQANRISRCKLTFSWQSGEGVGFQDETIVSGGLLVPSGVDTRQGSLWIDTVALSPRFFSAIREHGVPVSEVAVRQLNSQPAALDVYIWLTYRLHRLREPTRVSWEALYDQFGSGYSLLRNFRTKFRGVLKDALSVYPMAKVTMDEQGVILYPSPPPIAPRQYQVITAT